MGSRVILVEGPPGTGRTRLIQELTLQCDAQAQVHQWWPARRSGHPLRRPYDPAAYPTAEAYGSVLEVQWQNFATRVAADDVVYLFDAALLQDAFRALLAGGSESSRIAAICARLMDTLEPLAPRLLYLSRVDAPANADEDWHRWRSCCDEAFASLSQHRLLLNASRSDPQQLLAEALDFIDLGHRPLPVEDERLERLSGRYEAGGDEILITRELAGAAIRLPAKLGVSGQRPLLAGIDGSFLVAGCDLRIAPREQSGYIEGLLLETGDPGLAALPNWLPRVGD